MDDNRLQNISDNDHEQLRQQQIDIHRKKMQEEEILKVITPATKPRHRGRNTLLIQINKIERVTLLKYFNVITSASRQSSVDDLAANRGCRATLAMTDYYNKLLDNTFGTTPC